jgi:hypothetical protein
MQAEARFLPLCPRFATAVFGRVVKKSISAWLDWAKKKKKKVQKVVKKLSKSCQKAQNIVKKLSNIFIKPGKN